jgi:hypothetical protein
MIMTSHPQMVAVPGSHVLPTHRNIDNSPSWMRNPQFVSKAHATKSRQSTNGLSLGLRWEAPMHCVIEAVTQAVVLAPRASHQQNRWSANLLLLPRLLSHLPNQHQSLKTWSVNLPPTTALMTVFPKPGDQSFSLAFWLPRLNPSTLLWLWPPPMQLPIPWPLQRLLMLLLPGTLACARRTASLVRTLKMTIPPKASTMPPLVHSLPSWIQRCHVQSLPMCASAKQRLTCLMTTVASPVATRNQRPNRRRLWPNPAGLHAQMRGTRVLQAYCSPQILVLGRDEEN